MSSLIFTLLCSALVALCSADELIGRHHENFTLPGDCPNFPVQQNLDVQKASGKTWYGISGLWNGLNKQQDSCVKTTCELNQDGSLNSTFESRNAQNRKIIQNLKGTPLQAGKVGQYIYRPDNDPSHAKVITVLKTDYDNYLVSVSCQQGDGNHAYRAIINSRQQILTEALLNEAKAALQAANITNPLQPIDQNNCDA